MFRFAATVLLTGVALGCGASQSPAVEPENGLIAAANDEGIHLIEEDGAIAAVVPGTAGLAQPTWSPDGELLAAADGLDVVTLRPDGTERRRVITDASSPSWSPDGTQLVVMRDTCGDDEDCQLEVENPYDLYVVDADGTNLRRLTTDLDFDGHPHWSPNGDWIAFTAWDGIYLIRPDGTERQKILGDDVLYARAWSPDGEKLLFEDVENDPMVGIELAVLDVESGRRSDLPQMPGHQLLATWSPDGEKIAFLTTEECVRTGECTAHEPWELWLMDEDGGDARRIAGPGFGPPSWAAIR